MNPGSHIYVIPDLFEHRGTFLYQALYAASLENPAGASAGLPTVWKEKKSGIATHFWVGIAKLEVWCIHGFFTVSELQMTSGSVLPRSFGPWQQVRLIEKSSSYT